MDVESNSSNLRKFTGSLRSEAVKGAARMAHGKGGIPSLDELPAPGKGSDLLLGFVPRALLCVCVLAHCAVWLLQYAQLLERGVHACVCIHPLCMYPSIYMHDVGMPCRARCICLESGSSGSRYVHTHMHHPSTGKCCLTPPFCWQVLPHSTLLLASVASLHRHHL